MVADALNFPIDAVRFESEWGVATERIEVATGVIEPGQVAVRERLFEHALAPAPDPRQQAAQRTGGFGNGERTADKEFGG